MTQNNEPIIGDMNEVIALFMGYEKYEDRYGIWFRREGLIKCLHPKLQELKYHTSWDALKPVIDGIFKYAIAHPDKVQPIIDMSVVVDIKPAHEKVYQFCKWFNEQKQNNELTFDYKSRDWEESNMRPASKEAIARMKERWVSEGKRQCPDCGVWFKSEGRCPECNPMV